MADVTPLIWGYKYTREIARRMPLFCGEAALLHPKFPAGSKATVVAESSPFPMDTPPIVYTSEDDKAIEQYVRALGKHTIDAYFYWHTHNGRWTVATCWHSVGT